MPQCRQELVALVQGVTPCVNPGDLDRSTAFFAGDAIYTEANEPLNHASAAIRRDFEPLPFANVMSGPILAVRPRLWPRSGAVTSP